MSDTHLLKSKVPQTPDWIYEDQDVLVLNKPSGIPSARLAQSSPDQVTAVDWAREHYPALKTVGFSEHESGLVHRLDTGTSGILVFAKTQASFESLRAQWESRQVHKIYRAVVSMTAKSIQPIPATVDWPLAHHPKSKKKMICIPPHKSNFNFRGKLIEAQTLVLNSVTLPDSNHLDLTVEIKTGVMHQIRCHLAEVGYPILGDELYKGQKAERMFLHAWKLVLPLPSTSKSITFEAPLPW